MQSRATAKRDAFASASHARSNYRKGGKTSGALLARKLNETGEKGEQEKIILKIFLAKVVLSSKGRFTRYDRLPRLRRV